MVVLVPEVDLKELSFFCAVKLKYKHTSDDTKLTVVMGLRAAAD